MKKLVFFILILLGFGFTNEMYDAKIKESVPVLPIDRNESCAVQNRTFQSGEKITYAVYYNWGVIWIPAGEVVFKVKEEGDQYHFSVVGKTYKSYEWFFKVRDYYDSWVDKATLLPRVSVRDVREGGYTLYDKNKFNRSNNTIHNIRGRSLETVKEDNQFKVESCLHDMLSIVYFTRNFDFSNYQNGDTFPIKLFVDKQTWNLEVAYKGKEYAKNVKGLGYFNTLRFSPQVIEGSVFPKDTQVNMWVTNDANRVPVEIESPVSVGAVKAILQDYEGLRYEMTAKVSE